MCVMLLLSGEQGGIPSDVSREIISRDEDEANQNEDYQHNYDNGDDHFDDDVKVVKVVQESVELGDNRNRRDYDVASILVSIMRR